MDTSEQYIKMCDCPKIQKLRSDVPHIHDFVHDPDHYDNVIKNSGWQENSIWLPRQDQIQEMLQPIELHELLEVCGEPSGIIQTALHEYAESMEQLWLAFYMYEHHKKVWSSKEEKWVKK